MTLAMLIVLAVVALAILLFITEWVRFDIVGLLVLLSLAISGLITNEQALAGFSSPALITIASVLVLSGGLSKTGVANFVGEHVLGLAGGRPGTLTLLLMATAGVLSGIMNNIAVTALLLPVAIDLARKTQLAPSKLLIPLAFGSLLGGQLTLIGTAPNILISGFMDDAGREPFQMFDYAPVGVVVLLAGVTYMVFVGRRLLPSRVAPTAGMPAGVDLHAVYDLDHTLFTVTVPPDSALDGWTLADTRLGVALGLNVLAVLRNGEKTLSPPPEFVLQGGDRLAMQGRIEVLETVQSWKPLVQEGGRFSITEDLLSESVGMAEVEVPAQSAAIGHTVVEEDFRHRHGVLVVAIARGAEVRRTRLQEYPLQQGDALLLLGQLERLEAVRELADYTGYRPISSEDVVTRYRLQERLLRLRVPEGSRLAGHTLAESRLGDAFGFAVHEITRDGDTELIPTPETILEVGDSMLVAGRQRELQALEALQDLEIDFTSRPAPEVLESEEIGFGETTLSPRTTLIGRTLQELFFREKYGLTVLSIWRGDRSHHSNIRIRSMKLQLGDALLLYGQRSRLAMMAHDPDFLVVAGEGREILREPKAPLAGGIMAGVILTVALGWLPIQIAAPTGAVAMVLTGCLSPDDAYRNIEWRVLILIAGMLGLGTAMQESGAATLVAQGVLGSVAGLGPLAVVAALFLITALSAQLMPTAAVAVLMAPIALSSAADLSLSPEALMMTVAVASSCAFLSPVGHPANLLIWGIAGYRFTDYTRVGAFLLITVLAVVLLWLPVVWPLAG